MVRSTVQARSRRAGTRTARAAKSVQSKRTIRIGRQASRGRSVNVPKGY